MSSKQIPYRKINVLSPLVQDYLDEKPDLSVFYGRYNKIDSYRTQIQDRSQFSTDRQTLVEVLKRQNATLELSDLSKENIESLESEDTFTVTTGHQLCLFTGPLYFIYKIVSTINLAKELKKHYPSKHFVPIFWMASEDHDFDEINHAQLFGQTVRWNTKQGGAVGRMNLNDIPSVLKELDAMIGDDENAQQLKGIFHKAYSAQNLAQASRILVNSLFKNDGLVILDGDDFQLKKLFVEVMKKDICEKSFASIIALQSEKLSKNYKAQAHVREINFFKLEEGGRERIASPLDAQEVVNSAENFSPNVLMRPLYQELILPNLAYIGGGAEMAYWMQLKTAFEFENIPFPILVLRNSLLLSHSSQLNKIEKLGFSVEDFFNSEADLHKQYIQSQKDFSLDRELDSLTQLFDKMKSKFEGDAHKPIIDAEHKRQKNSLEKLAKKLYRIEKVKHETALSQISKIKASFFPNATLQERYDNFIPYYLKYGDNFIKKLKDELNPLDTNFVVLAL